MQLKHHYSCYICHTSCNYFTWCAKTCDKGKITLQSRYDKTTIVLVASVATIAPVPFVAPVRSVAPVPLVLHLLHLLHMLHLLYSCCICYFCCIYCTIYNTCCLHISSLQILTYCASFVGPIVFIEFVALVISVALVT